MLRHDETRILLLLKLSPVFLILISICISYYTITINNNNFEKKQTIIEQEVTNQKEQNDKKSYFEIIYVSIVKIEDAIKDKKEMEKIILCDVQNIIYPDLEKSFLNLVHNSGFPNIKLEKKIDFNKLYNERFN